MMRNLLAGVQRPGPARHPGLESRSGRAGRPTIDSLPFTRIWPCSVPTPGETRAAGRAGAKVQDLHNSLRPTGTISRTTRMRRTLSNAPAWPQQPGPACPMGTECQLFAGTDSSRQAGIYLQSAAVSNTILDWAQQREMGFSYFIALGDSTDIDVDDLLDFLARDSKTSAILLYLEHLSDARRFVSAARSASRNKPILVIKAAAVPPRKSCSMSIRVWIRPGTPRFNGRAYCACRILMSCSLRLKPSAICARYAVRN